MQCFLKCRSFGAMVLNDEMKKSKTMGQNNKNKRREGFLDFLELVQRVITSDYTLPVLAVALAVSAIYKDNFKAIVGFSMILIPFAFYVFGWFCILLYSLLIANTTLSDEVDKSSRKNFRGSLLHDPDIQRCLGDIDEEYLDKVAELGPLDAMRWWRKQTASAYWSVLQKKASKLFQKNNKISRR